MHAGAHEDILVYRKTSGKVDTVTPVGTWLAATPTIEGVTENRELMLEPGDVMLLHTDGVTEARDENGECFGFERLIEHFTAHGARPVEEICETLVAEVRRFSPLANDDLTLLVARQVGAG